MDVHEMERNVTMGNLCNRTQNWDCATPKYSICICNYNMGDTLRRSLRSVLDQIGPEFEVVVVDDGSNDESPRILVELQNECQSLRVCLLRRNRQRQLGETRNISVREARGDYVLLHVDTDDVWEPYIADFTKIFHRLEECLGRDILVAGQQLNMGRREFLLDHGPYRNTARAEDRDMWARFAAMGAYIPLEHTVFRSRLSRPRKVQRLKSVRDTWHQILYDMRRSPSPINKVVTCWRDVFRRDSKKGGAVIRCIRAGMSIPAFAVSRTLEPLPVSGEMRTYQDFANYRERYRGTFPDIMRRNGCSADLSFLRPQARRIFASRTQSRSPRV